MKKNSKQHSPKRPTGAQRSRWDSKEMKTQERKKQRYGVTLTREQLPQGSAVHWHMRPAVTTATSNYPPTNTHTHLRPKILPPPSPPISFYPRYKFILSRPWPSEVPRETVLTLQRTPVSKQKQNTRGSSSTQILYSSSSTDTPYDKRLEALIQLLHWSLSCYVFYVI